MHSTIAPTVVTPGPPSEGPDGPDRRGSAGFVPAPFDYGKLAADLASEARAAATRINESKRNHVLDVGRALIEMKEKLGHGQFTDWVDRELNFSTATARNYMAAAREFGDTPLIVSVLPPALIYRLAGAPEPVRAEIVTRVEAGEHVDRAEVEAVLQQRRREAEEARKTPEQRKKEADARRRRERDARKWREEREVEAEQERQRGREAAAELLRILGEHFDREKIYHLNSLWAAARFEFSVLEARGNRG